MGGVEDGAVDDVVVERVGVGHLLGESTVGSRR